MIADHWIEPLVSNHWRLCEEFTLKQAALLIVDCDPGSDYTHCEDWGVQQRPAGYEAAKQALTAALRRKSIIGSLVGLPYTDINGDEGGEIQGTVDLDRSTLDRESLVAWLRSRGVTSGFFFPSKSGEPDYLDPNHPRYSAKLAASVRAWMAMEDENLRRGRSILTAITTWLESRYLEFGLVHRQDGGEKANYKAGDRNDGAIRKAAQVANWQIEGGAPKTPTT